MFFERLIREQVYKYKRRQYLRNSKGNKVSTPQFVVFNINKPRISKSVIRRKKSESRRAPINRSAVDTKSLRRSSSRSRRTRNFYSSPISDMGGRRVLGIACIILAIILMCTQCFNRNIQQAMANENELSVALDETTDSSQKEKGTLGTENISKQEDTKKNTSTLQSYYESIQNLNMEAKGLDKLFAIATKNKRGYSQALAIWSIGKLHKSTDKEIYELIKNYDHEYMLKNYPRYEESEVIYKQFIYDMKYFPIAKYQKYIFKPSWQERELFEESDLYGVDIINPKNNTGEIPIVSITDGVIEGLGWHEIGGFRVGIRSTGGAYFYYGHLDSLPTHIQKGDTVQAGDYLGLMGNTGYGTEGTRGEIPVKLHIGISVSNKDDKQFWINPYPFIKYIEDNKVAIKHK